MAPRRRPTTPRIARFQPVPRLPFDQLALDDSQGLVAHPRRFAPARAGARVLRPRCSATHHTPNIPTSTTIGDRRSSAFISRSDSRLGPCHALPGMTPSPHSGREATLCSSRDLPVAAAFPRIAPSSHSSYVCWPQPSGLHRACPDTLQVSATPFSFAAVVRARRLNAPLSDISVRTS